MLTGVKVSSLQLLRTIGMRMVVHSEIFLNNVYKPKPVHQMYKKIARIPKTTFCLTWIVVFWLNQNEADFIRSIAN